MSPNCKVCTSTQRDAIERCLAAGDSLRDVEKTFGISKSALWRHKTEHLSLYSPGVAGVPAVIAKSDDLLAQLKDLITRTLLALDRAEAAGDDRMFLLAVREARSNTELMMKAQAYLADRAAKEAPPEGHKIIFMYPDVQRRIEDNMARLGEIVEALRTMGQPTDLQAMDESGRKAFLERLLGPVKPMVSPGAAHDMPDDGVEARTVDILRKRGYTVTPPEGKDGNLSVWHGELKQKVDRMMNAELRQILAGGDVDYMGNSTMAKVAIADAIHLLRVGCEGAGIVWDKVRGDAGYTNPAIGEPAYKADSTESPNVTVSLNSDLAKEPGQINENSPTDPAAVHVNPDIDTTGPNRDKSLDKEAAPPTEQEREAARQWAEREAEKAKVNEQYMARLRRQMQGR